MPDAVPGVQGDGQYTKANLAEGAAGEPAAAGGR